MPAAHSHPPPPSPPSYANTTTAPPTPSIRRNLFSTHLSRRPASSSQATQEPSASTFIPPLSHTRSPSRSPGHSPSHPPFRTDAIIATHPNGRPLLPTLPRLPAHLRLSTGEDDEEEAYELEDEASRNNSPTRYNRPQLPSDTNDSDERARIERSLVDMMYRQRQRANPGLNLGSSTSPRALRSGIAAAEDGEKSREEEELLNLVMASLREKVAVLESEGWMFGERGEEAGALV